MVTFKFDTQLFALGSNAVTLNDYAKRLDPNGQLAYVIEVLAQSNPIMEDIAWIEGNLPTGMQTTQRTSIPKPSIRKINRGVKHTKSTTAQITDTCCILEARSQVDVELLALYKDAAAREAFRKSEDAAHVEGFSQAIADYLFYGDIVEDSDTFNGLSVRYNTFTGEKGTYGYQTVNAGAPGEKTNTSCFLVGWGERTTAGIYPSGSEAGLKMKDLGEGDAFDKDSNPFRALQTLFTWKPGLMIRDPRANATIRNIDTAKFNAFTSAQKLSLMEQFTEAGNRIRNLDNGSIKYVWYVSEKMKSFIDKYYMDKNNVSVTRQQLEGKKPQLYINGIPVRKCEAINDNETAITA